jgi:hypothetical protein
MDILQEFDLDNLPPGVGKTNTPSDAPKALHRGHARIMLVRVTTTDGLLDNLALGFRDAGRKPTTYVEDHPVKEETGFHCDSGWTFIYSDEISPFILLPADSNKFNRMRGSAEARDAAINRAAAAGELSVFRAPPAYGLLFTDLDQHSTPAHFIGDVNVHIPAYPRDYVYFATANTPLGAYVRRGISNLLALAQPA